MKKLFGMKPSPDRIEVSVGHGPLPRIDPKGPSGAGFGLVRVIVLLISGIVAVVILRLAAFWLAK